MLFHFFRRYTFFTQQAQNMCITFIQRRINVEDVWPTLYIAVQMFCLCWVQFYFFTVYDQDDAPGLQGTSENETTDTQCKLIAKCRVLINVGSAYLVTDTLTE